MSLIGQYLETNPKLIQAVVCFPVKGDNILLMHRLKTSDGLGQDLVSGIGGRVGDQEEFADETHEQALGREMREEIGITPTRYRKVGRVRFVWETNPNWNMDVTIYIIDAWEGEPTETPVARPVWHKISNLPTESMWEDNAHWLPRVLAGEKDIDAIFCYGKEKTITEYVFL